MTKKETEKILNSKGLDTIYLPKFAMFSKTTKKKDFDIEFQIELDESMKFQEVNINAFISENLYTEEDDIQKLYDNFITEIENIKKTHLDIIKLFESNKVTKN